MDIIGVDREEGVIPFGMENVISKVITAKQVPDNVSDLDYLFFSMPGVNIPPILSE